MLMALRRLVWYAFRNTINSMGTSGLAILVGLVAYFLNSRPWNPGWWERVRGNYNIGIGFVLASWFLVFLWNAVNVIYTSYDSQKQQAIANASRTKDLERQLADARRDNQSATNAPQAVSSTSKTPPVSVASPSDAWLQAVAKDDHANIGNRIVRQGVEAQGNNLTALEPFIDIRITMTNASVFALKCVRVEGRVMFSAKPLQAPSQLISEGMNLSHGSTKTVVIRQYVQPDTVASIRQNKGQLSAGQTALWLEYEFQGEVKGLRIGGPNAMEFTGF